MAERDQDSDSGEDAPPRTVETEDDSDLHSFDDRSVKPDQTKNK